METIDKTLLNPIEVCNVLDEQYTREQWQNKCTDMLKVGMDKFNEWQLELSTQQELCSKKTDFFTWTISYVVNGADKSYSVKNVPELSKFKNGIVIDLSNQVFDGGLDLTGYNFLFPVSFCGGTFNGVAIFKDCVFNEKAYFFGATFNAATDFTDSFFYQKADFFKSIIKDNAIFYNVKFKKDLCFELGVFQCPVNFYCAEFEGYTNFEGAIFKEEADFTGDNYAEDGKAEFEKLQTFSHISFNGVHFEKRAKFNNRNFTGDTSFGKYGDQLTKFQLAPLFHNCKLYQGTTFVNAVFETSKDDSQAAQAFNTLKLAMSQQQSTRDEQLFIKKELDTERLSATSLREKTIYWLYLKTSNYGFSASRSFCLLLLCSAIFGLFYGLLIYWQNCNQLLPGYSCQFNASLIWKTVRFTFLQSLPPLGIDGYSIPIKNDLFCKISSGIELFLTVIIAVQKVIALAGWFLIALALRNLFKVK